MEAAGALELERMAEVAALERPARAKRMLVIVNPYATTMSDRLKHLVVYALQGRYDVRAVDTQRRGRVLPRSTQRFTSVARRRHDRYSQPRLRNSVSIPPSTR